MPARPAAVAAARDVAPVSLSPLDPDAVDLPADRQHEIAALESRIRSKNPREVLGVAASASIDEVKTAYFGLAQRFHPDQFFRKRLGTFKAKVEEVFARANWAFQELSRNPNAGQPAPEAVEAPHAAAEPEAPPLDDEGFPAAESSDLPDMVDEEAASITGRPRDRYRKAMLRQRWDVAADALNSLAHDEPDALDLPKLRAELSRKKAEAEAKTLFDQGNDHGAKSSWTEAFKCYQQAAALDPRNAVYVERAGRALLYEGDLKEAKRLVERALELKPEDPVAHVTLANVFLKAGMERNAKREFEAALKIDPKNEYAKSQVRKGWWKG